MENKFLVVEDGEGNFLPMAGIARYNEAGVNTAGRWKLSDDDKVVVVEFKKVGELNGLAEVE